MKSKYVNRADVVNRLCVQAHTVRRSPLWLAGLLAAGLATTHGTALAVETAIAVGHTDPAVPVSALKAAMARSDTPAVESVDSSAPPAQPDKNRAAAIPEGATQHQFGREMTAVQRQPVRIKRNSPKPVAAAPLGSYFSNTPPEHTPAPLSLGFVSGEYIPEAGVDEALLAAIDVLQAQGRQHTYGFLLMDEFLVDETRAELEALGLSVLAPHASAYKVILPLDTAKLDAIAALPYVHWLGYSLPEQKLDLELQAILDDARQQPDELAVIINLFDDDPEENFKRELEQLGVAIASHDAELQSYTGLVSPAALSELIALDFVLAIEQVQTGSGHHDQSTPTVGADYIRTAFDGLPISIGIMDSGADMGGTGHLDLNKYGCGWNFTTDTTGPFQDDNGHGSHVLGTIVGTGTADSRNTGVAPGGGELGGPHIRVAKVLNSANVFLDNTWVTNGMDFMDDATACNSVRPDVVNVSLGTNNCALDGTDTLSRTLDSKTWNFGQLYVVSAGNSGPGVSTVCSPGVAKTALTVGNVEDAGFNDVGDIWTSSSRGPTVDQRLKPNLVAPGRIVTSVMANSFNQYTNMTGTSMAAPHVTGLAATLMEHYSDFVGRPALTRAFLMASSIPHNGVDAPDNRYGLGRISSNIAHWAYDDPDGWSGHWAWGNVDNNTSQQFNITVPSGTDRLVVVMTWDEPAASSNAIQAVIDDIDLYVDCAGCGSWNSTSTVDNVEYVIINNPPAGTYTLTASPVTVTASRPVGIAVTVIEGDPTPATSLSGIPSTTTPLVGDTFTITTTVDNPAYIASGVHLEHSPLPSGVTLVGVSTTREDNITMDFGTADELTLGNIWADDSRSADWQFQATSSGSKTISFRSWSENGGQNDIDVTVNVLTPPDLTVPSLTLNKTVMYTGEAFTVNATVENLGMAASSSSTLRYLLSQNPTISTFDTQLTTDFVGALSGGDTEDEVQGMFAPATAGTWYIGACVDTVANESNTANQCFTPGIAITVLNRPDLRVSGLTLSNSTPAPGEPFTINATVTNDGSGSSAATTLHYYLSNDSTIDTSDTPIGNPTSSSIGGLVPNGVATAASAANAPALSTVYFIGACIDPVSGESDTANNCYSPGESLAMLPAAPSGVNASDGGFNGFVRVTWNFTNNASSYEVHRADSLQSKFSTLVGTTSGSNSTTFDDTTVTLGETYYYWVKACNPIGCSAPGGPDSGFAVGLGVTP